MTSIRSRSTVTAMQPSACRVSTSTTPRTRLFIPCQISMRLRFIFFLPSLSLSLLVVSGAGRFEYEASVKRIEDRRPIGEVRRLEHLLARAPEDQIVRDQRMRLHDRGG